MTDNTDTTETAVDRASASAKRNLAALSPKRILALYTLASFVWLGVQLGNISVPFKLGLLAFVFMALAAAHSYQRQAAGGADVVVAGYVVLSFALVGAQLDVLAVPLGPDWVALVVLGLIAADGYIISRPT